jgi:hypothetical protein
MAKRTLSDAARIAGVHAPREGEGCPEQTLRPSLDLSSFVWQAQRLVLPLG